MRTFQFSDAKSHKFWTIDVEGDGFTVTYGKVGTAGQTQTKSFPSPEKAQAEADKLVREKTGKGYVETTPRATTSVAEALEATIRAEPNDLAAWCAYADHLTEADDPRGEFMQVQIALEDEGQPAAARKKLKAREKALLKAHGRDWLGPLGDIIHDSEPVDYWDGGKRATRAPVGYRFDRGWLSRVEFYNLTVAQARALAASPGARLLRELVVEQAESEAPAGSEQQYIDTYYEPGPDVPAGLDAYNSPGLYALCRCPHLAGVRLFCLGEGMGGPDGKDEEYSNCHTDGETAHHLVKQMPNLEELYVLAHNVDAAKLFALPLPKLRVFQLYHGRSYPLDKLAANPTLSKLTTLLCHPHALEYDDEEEQGAYIRLPHLRAICRSPHLGSLSFLRLRLSNFGDKGAEEIVSSGVLKRLRTLDLQGGCITDEGAKALAACPDLKNLTLLNLRTNAVGEAGQAALGATGVACDLSAQHGEAPGDGDGETPNYLFEGDIE
jgi:uncharacterized protein (TIGR02996 family)